MALIEKEDVIAELNWMFSRNTISTERIIDTIKKMPRADAVLVKHGKWIREKLNDGEVAYCSKCGTYVEVDMVEELVFRYCPWCGAKMDAQEDEKCSM